MITQIYLQLIERLSPVVSSIILFHSLKLIPQMFLKRKLFLYIICAAIYFGSFNTPILAQPDSLVYQSQTEDSTRHYRKKYKSKKTWEHIVSLPGTIISIPFVLFFKAQEALVGYTFEKELIPKVKNAFTSDDGLRGIVPKFSNRKGYGAKFYQEQILSATDDLSLTVSGNMFKGRERYRLRWRNIQIASSPLYLSTMGRYRFLPKERFFGIGPETKTSDKRVYDHENTAIMAGIDIRTSSTFTINTLFRYDHDNASGGDDDETPSVSDDFDRQTLPGLQSRVKIIQAKLGFTLDTKNYAEKPTAGREIKLSGTIFQDVDDGPFNFRKIQGDYREFINFGRDRVLALRLGFEFTDLLDETEDKVPFYYLSELGVSTTIRGYDRGRFRDLDMVLGSAEYRIPIWRTIDFTTFVDAGQVANDIFNDFQFRDLRFGFGGGLRLYSSKNLVATILAAFSREKFRLLFTLN